MVKCRNTQKVPTPSLADLKGALHMGALSEIPVCTYIRESLALKSIVWGSLMLAPIIMVIKSTTTETTVHPK